MESQRAWGLAPILRVRDVRASAAYYREKLGLKPLPLLAEDEVVYAPSQSAGGA